MTKRQLELRAMVLSLQTYKLTDEIAVFRQEALRNYLLDPRLESQFAAMVTKARELEELHDSLLSLIRSPGS